MPSVPPPGAGSGPGAAPSPSEPAGAAGQPASPAMAPSGGPSVGPPPGAPTDMTPGPPPVPADREIILQLGEPAARGLLGRRRGPEGTLRLVGNRVELNHRELLPVPLEFQAGRIALVAFEADLHPTDAVDFGRFAVLKRLSATAVIDASDGIEGWLWTHRLGSVHPVVAGEGVVPNVALVFDAPLDPDRVRACFAPPMLQRIEERSPLGEPAVGGLLLRVADREAAEAAFSGLGLVKPLTDREVPPAQQRHLPGDRPASPPVEVDRGRDSSRSVPPPGM